MLNVALGGTLIQDLPSQHRREEGLPAMSHRQTALGQYPSHRVEVAEGSLLEQIVGQREIWVNSFHHQAVGEVASCANLSAWAADGVVEAIELPDAPFVLGVQWHPEIMTRLEDEASRRLFAAFAKALADKDLCMVQRTPDLRWQIGRFSMALEQHCSAFSGQIHRIWE